MKNDRYDVVILGGGNAGMGVTVATREAGLSVAMVEPRQLGGTCPNRGCTPKKVLVAAAHALHEIEQAATHGIRVDRPALDWGALIEREQRMIAPIPDGLGKLMASRGVEVVRGAGRFVSPKAIRVGDRLIEAANLVIATGSKPRRLDFPGADLMMTSDDVLSGRELPASVLFIGGGVIALEFSHVYARAGAKVTILEVLPRLLPSLDGDAVGRLQRETERIGVVVRTGVKVRRIERRSRRLCVVFEQDGAEQTIEVDAVVNGAGRVADLDGLDLEAADVAHDGTRIETDPWMRSVSNPAVHVCGDALWSTPQLSPIATYEGRLVGRNIVDGPRHEPDYAAIPTCIFSVPALASVGLTEEKARQSGLKLRVAANDMLGWLSARTFAETAAWAKLLIDEATDRIVGAHMIGHAAEELIHLFAMAMKHGITASAMRETVYAFPTFSADIKSML